MFNESIPILEIETNKIAETYCEGNIMQMMGEYEIFLFMEMSRGIGGNHCLFGLTTINAVKYSNWDSIGLYEIAFNHFKWDRAMNYSELSNDSYLAVKSNGLWTGATSTVSCVVCVVDNFKNFEDPTLLLNYDILNSEIALSVTDEEFSFREMSSDPGFICFAVIDTTYVSNLTVHPVSRNNYLVNEKRP